MPTLCSWPREIQRSRTSSKFGARLEPFCHVDVQFHPGRSLDIITQVQTLDAFGVGIVTDYQRYTAACAILETADRLTAEEGEPVVRLYLLVTGALRALSAGERDPSLLLDAFLMRAMAFAGWAPAVNECASPIWKRSASRARERSPLQVLRSRRCRTFRPRLRRPDRCPRRRSSNGLARPRAIRECVTFPMMAGKPPMLETCPRRSGARSGGAAAAEGNARSRRAVLSAKVTAR